MTSTLTIIAVASETQNNFIKLRKCQFDEIFICSNVQQLKVKVMVHMCSNPFVVKKKFFFTSNLQKIETKIKANLVTA